jgi:hypothetical protein
MTQLIQRVAHLQTGTADLHVQHVEGSPWNALLWIFFGRERIEGLPLSVYIIEHRDAVIIVDAGMAPRIATDPEFWPDPITHVIMNKIFRFHIEPEDALGIQLRRVGIAPEDVDKAIITHLHFDHAGGIADIPRAELITSKEAWDHMLRPYSEREGVLRRDIDTRARSGGRSNTRRSTTPPCSRSPVDTISWAMGVIAELNPILQGWFGYFKHAHRTTFRAVDGFVRRRLRAVLRKRDKRPGFGLTSGDHHRWPNAYFATHGLFTLHEAHVLASQSR